MTHDIIDNPGHYTFGRSIEPIDAIEDWRLGYHLGQVVKYVSRAGRKGSALEDLKKARWYLDRRIAMIDMSDMDHSTASAWERHNALHGEDE